MKRRSFWGRIVEKKLKLADKVLLIWLLIPIILGRIQEFLVH